MDFVVCVFVYVTVDYVRVIPFVDEVLRFHWLVVELDGLRDLSVGILRVSGCLMRVEAFFVDAHSSCDRYHVALSSTSMVFMAFDHLFGSNNLSIFVSRFKLLHEVRTGVDL